MNPLSIYIPLIFSLWWLWLLALAIFLYRLFKTSIKGRIGEMIVALFLSRLDSRKYRVLNNVLLPIGGQTAQIDHIVVSNFGIFVIETKNYSGWIFGDESSLNWTQIIYRSKKKFYNPIKQNQRHIAAIQSVLSGYPSLYFISLVVFSMNVTFKFRLPMTGVIRSINVLREIRHHSDELISDVERDRIYTVLQTSNIMSSGRLKKHIQAIQDNARA